MCNRIVSVLLCLLLFTSLTGFAEEKPFTVTHGSRDEKRIAITIDDCYDAQWIEAAVALCEQYGVVFTFFPIGKALKFADGPLWQRALDAGCEIGNHTWGHALLTKQSRNGVRFHLLRIQQKVDEMLGYHYLMQVMRAPYGKISSDAAGVAKALGYHHAVKWDVSQTDPDKALHDVQNGSILLFHGRKKDVNCLKVLIPALLERGYECVTVSALLNLPPVEISPDIYTYQK